MYNGMKSSDRKKSTFMVDDDIFRSIKILAIQKKMDISQVIEESMREKLDREYPEYKKYMIKK